MNELEKINKRIKELEDKYNNDTKKLYLIDEYRKLSDILAAVKMMIKVGVEIDDKEEDEFADVREQVFSDSYLEQIAIFIENYDLLKGPLPEFIDRNELYNYINSESSKKRKK